MKGATTYRYFYQPGTISSLLFSCIHRQHQNSTYSQKNTNPHTLTQIAYRKINIKRRKISIFSTQFMISFHLLCEIVFVRPLLLHFFSPSYTQFERLRNFSSKNLPKTPIFGAHRGKLNKKKKRITERISLYIYVYIKKKQNKINKDTKK